MSRNQMLIEFRACYDRLEAARRSGDVQALDHAERNFYATSEGLARLMPRFADEFSNLLEAVSS